MSKISLFIILALSVASFSIFAKSKSTTYICPEKLNITPRDSYQFSGDKNNIEFSFSKSATGKDGATGYYKFYCYYGPSTGSSYNFYTDYVLSPGDTKCPYGAIFDIENIPQGMDKSIYTGNMRFYDQKIIVNPSLNKKKAKKIQVDCYYGGPQYFYYSGIIKTTRNHSKCAIDPKKPRIASCK